MKKIFAGIIMFASVFCTIGSDVIFASVSDRINVEYQADFSSAPSGDTIVKSSVPTKWFEDDKAIWYGSKKNGYEWSVAGFSGTSNSGTAKIIVWPGGESDLKYKPKLGDCIFGGLKALSATIYTGEMGNAVGCFAEVRCMVSKDAASYIAFGTETDSGRIYYSKDGKKIYIGQRDTTCSGSTINIEIAMEKSVINYVIDGHPGRIAVKDMSNRNVNTEYPIVLYGGLGNEKQVLFSDIHISYYVLNPSSIISLPYSAIIGRSGTSLEKNSILDSNASQLQSYFSTTGGKNEWIKDEDGNKVGLKYTFSAETTNNAIFGTGKKSEASSADFGIDDENFKYSELEFEIKAESIKPQDISINLGFTPVSDKWADYAYYGRRLYKAVSVACYADNVGDWKKITIPLSDFNSERTAQYCIPGTDIWTYEKVDWSKFNLIHVNAESSSQSSSLCIRNVSFNIAKFVDCTAEYGFVDEEMNAVKNLEDAREKNINCIIRATNLKTTVEKIKPMIIAYKEGKVVYAEMTEIEVQPNSQKYVRVGSFTTPKNTDGFVVKALILGENGEMYGNECIIK